MEARERPETATGKNRTLQIRHVPAPDGLRSLWKLDWHTGCSMQAVKQTLKSRPLTRARLSRSVAWLSVGLRRAIFDVLARPAVSKPPKNVGRNRP